MRIAGGGMGETKAEGRMGFRSILRRGTKSHDDNQFPCPAKAGEILTLLSSGLGAGPGSRFSKLTARRASSATVLVSSGFGT